MGVLSRRRQVDAEDVLLGLVREHAGELLRFARRFSLCGEDAQDAYQRALEIMVQRLHRGPVDKPLSYLRTIIRHEAGRVRIEREKLLGREELDIDRHTGSGSVDPAEHAERFERLAHAAEALRRLKPQELTALSMRAEGLSYKEICDRLDWTYTRCNRAITEGRRALLARLEAIESGAECERWLPLLSTLADREATAVQLSELRPHLRSCPGCRATLRSFHEAPAQLRAIVPPEIALAAVATAGAGGGLWRHGEALVHGALERLSIGALRLHGTLDALPGAKVAAVAASTVAVAGGGAAIQHVAKTHHARPRHDAIANAAPSTAEASTRPISLPLPGGTAALPSALGLGGGTPVNSAAAAGAANSRDGAEWAPARGTVEWASADAAHARVAGLDDEFGPRPLAAHVSGATGESRAATDSHASPPQEFKHHSEPPAATGSTAAPQAQATTAQTRPTQPVGSTPPPSTASLPAPEYRPDHSAEFGGH